MKSSFTCFKWALFVALAAAVTNGCSNRNDAQPSGEPQAQALISLSPRQERQKQQAISARDKLFESLLGELTRSMAEKGPSKSIAVCKERAPQIARNVGAETGVQIGRTSFRIRNKNNTAPAWAASFVQNKVETEVAVELPEKGLGILLPIRLQAACTLCHGADQEIMPEVKAAIVSHYPNDDATGFSEGDVRGYFWIEVPGTVED